MALADWDSAPRATRHAPGAAAVQALRETWSRYPREWEADAGLSMGVQTLGEEGA